MEEKNINEFNSEELTDESAESAVNETPPESAAEETDKTSANEEPASGDDELVLEPYEAAFDTVFAETAEKTVEEAEIKSEEIPQAPVLESAEITPVEPAAYAFRWDYDEQRKHDDDVKKRTSPSKGVATYVTILSATFILAVAILFASIFIGDNLTSGRPSTPMQYSDSLALDGLYEYCLPSYVAISIVKDNGGEGVGSGIIITEDGYICTNYHVVEGADKITVLTSDNKKLSAEYIDGDEVNDIAVIKVSAKNLTAAKLGSSANTKIGERVMAIGTPFSISYAGSMTAGYISGIDRQYAVKNDNGTVNKILKLIQTDTSVNPGNSGGPLFNMNGEVIGVVTLKIAGSNYEGMGFVLPIDGVKDMIFDIIENGKITDSNAGSAVKGAALGISGHAVEADTKYLMTAEYCIQVKSDDKGDYIEWSTSGLYTQKIYVTDTETLEAVGLEDAYPYLAPCTGILVKTTSAGFDSSEKLNIDDVIISANGIACDSMSTLQELIFNSRVGDVLNLEIYRNGATINVDVKLGVANSME